MLYVDSSAFLKRYIAEADSERAEQHLLADPQWVTARHTRIEVRRNLARLLEGRALDSGRNSFEMDWERTNVVALDETTCNLAVDVAEATGARTLDALHLAAALRAGGSGSTFVTLDIRQGQAARSLGMVVVGA